MAPPKRHGAERRSASLPTDAISYEDLYARWERGNWSATALDFTEDARQWREDFTEFERQAPRYGTTACSSGARTPLRTTCRPTSTPPRERSRSTS